MLINHMFGLRVGLWNISFGLSSWWLIWIIYRKKKKIVARVKCHEKAMNLHCLELCFVESAIKVP